MKENKPKDILLERGINLGTRFNTGAIGTTDAMVELALSFPTLKAHFLGLHHGSWDIERFMSDLGVLSSGERYAKLFVASVWDPAWPAEHGLEFRVVDAIAVWDAAHKRAFLQWCLDPFWP